MPTSPNPTNSNQSIPLNQSVPQDPLAELRNLHLPQSIDSWPWAPGWYFLIAFVVIGTSLSIYFWIKHKHASLYKRQALQQLQTINGRYQSDPNAQQTAEALSALLKQVALVHFSREKISRLSGDTWLQFLDQLSNSKHFTQGAGTFLGDRLFQSQEKKPECTEKEIEELIKHCEHLIKQLDSKRIKEIQI